MAEKKQPAQPGKKSKEEMFEDMPVISLDAEDGRTLNLRVFDEINLEGKRYLAVFEEEAPDMPADQQGQLVILQENADADGKYYDVVEDDELLLRLGKIVDKHVDAFNAASDET